ncbi:MULTISPECIES: hypothetical protein [Ramlibacter]|uniref:DUF4148 domain-containing protein n=1 Tax=Ramlibacter aquaticus TaxID=2780094 RepID=A0ABR9SH46_9BURK|nr:MULTISPECIES: hypothetical protein [Ramlibacter]MBE7941670.1 hypothetical protein [Ramlibacter aquaticus]
MSNTSRTICLGAAALVASGVIWAQTPDTHSKRSIPGYSSAFEGYRPFESGEIQDWRKSNETVREVGGWRAYAREIQGAGSQAGNAAPASQPTGRESPSKQADPHQGHH